MQHHVLGYNAFRTPRQGFNIIFQQRIPNRLRREVLTME